MKYANRVALALILIGCAVLLLLQDSRVVKTASMSTITKHAPTITTKTQVDKKRVERYKTSSVDSQAAFDFVMSRRDAYEERGVSKRWKMRGVGYLYHYWNLVLHATLPSEPVRSGRNVVTIRNIMEDERYPMSSYIETNGIPYINCSLWTIYVRANGPEIFAGPAEAVLPTTATAKENQIDDCYWEFPFDLQVPGSYIVDVKILYYNASSIMETPCTVNAGKIEDDSRIHPNDVVFAGFKGFKMYQPAEMCCEICSRLYNDCIYWSTPPLHLIDEPHVGNNGCDLYFRDNTSEWIPESAFVNNELSLPHPPNEEMNRMRQLRRGSVDEFHGPPNGPRPVYFAGCGWSFWMTLDFACINGDLDDRIYVSNNITGSTFTLFEEATDTTKLGTKMENNSPLPYCTLDMELPDRHYGRWVRKPWPDVTMCPHDMERDPDNSEQFVIMKHDPQHPQCYHRDNLSIVGHNCIEMNCQFITQESKWMTSSLHLEKNWYGTFEQYKCQYFYDYTDDELQTCIDERKIFAIDGSGFSIWHFLRQYLYQRIANLTMYDNKDDDGLEIHLSSLALTHVPLNTLRDSLTNDRPVLDPNKMEFYWVNSLFMSSEREQEARGIVQQMKSDIAQEVLGPKNYRMLNLYDMTKAFSYDTATQMDGLHIIGPPMKMIMSKLFHYVCFNTSVGPR